MGGKGSSRWPAGYERAFTVEDVPELSLKAIQIVTVNFLRSYFKKIPFWIRSTQRILPVDGKICFSYGHRATVSISGLLRWQEHSCQLYEEIPLQYEFNGYDYGSYYLACPSCGDPARSLFYIPDLGEIRCRFEGGLVYQSCLKSPKKRKKRK